MTDEGPKIPGRRVTLAGREYVLAPLRLSQLKDHEDEIASLQPFIMNPDVAAREQNPTIRNPKFVEPKEHRAIVARVVMASLSRNYETVFNDAGRAVPLSEETVLDILDLGTWLEAFNAALAVSGLTQGETGAVRASESGEFTPPSPPATGGPTETSERIH